MALIPEVTLPIIIGGALLDSINPCVIGVMILLLTVLLRTKKKSTILKHGAFYILGVYFTYLIGGITLLSFFQIEAIRVVSTYLYGIIGIIILIAGFLEVKDYFWYGRWFSLSIFPRFVKSIEDAVVHTKASYLASFSFGVFVTLVELPCTGAPYLAVLALLTFLPFIIGISYLLLYNLIFILPLLLIIFLAYKGTSLKVIEKWRRKRRPLMRLLIGLFLIGLSLFIFWIVASNLILYISLISGIILISMFLIKRIKK